MYGTVPESTKVPDIKVTGFDWRETPVPSRTGTKSNGLIINDQVSHRNKVRSYTYPKRWVVDRIGQRGHALEIHGWDSDTLSIDVYYDGTLYENRLSFLRQIFKIRNWSFAEYEDILAKDFVYNVFEPLWQIRLLEEDAAFLHAAAISVDDQGVALTGSGGAGKTSATSSLLKQYSNINFVSDDLAIVTGNGKIHPYYKSSVIYDYNTKGGAVPTSSFLTGPIDKLQWFWREQKYGEKGVRRRVSPEKLFGEQVSSPNPINLDTILYLSREECDQLSYTSVSGSELARRSTAVITDELDWMIEYSSSVCSVRENFIAPQDILKRIEHIYRNAFFETDTVLIRIPQDTRPEELAKYVNSNVL